MKRVLRVLFIASLEDDIIPILREIEKGGYSLQWRRIGTAGEMTSALIKHIWDAVIIDSEALELDGTAALQMVRGKALDVPVFIISGADEGSAVEAMRAGANDYIVKGNYLRLVPAIERELREARIRSGKRQVEAALRESEERYRSLINNINVGVYRNTPGPRGSFIAVNPACVRMFGYESEEEFLSINVSDTYWNPGEREEISEKLLRMGYLKEEELKLKKKDGTSLIGSVTAITVKDEKGEVLCFAGIIEDVTDRRRAEEKLRHYAAELERSNRELEHFAYIASHDLREPLRKIAAFGSLLVSKYRNALDERGQDYLQRIQSAAERMQKLITDLLEYSRVTSSGKPFAPVDLSIIIQEVIADLEILIERTDGQVTVGDMPTIDADGTQIHQLLQNLIGNALKFHKEDRTPVVKVQGQVLNGTCQITVEDNGIGFDEKDLDRIFGIFQRLHHPTEYEGTGIGLAICSRIVERHNGKITANSTPGQGSKFIVNLPVRQGRNKT